MKGNRASWISKVRRAGARLAPLCLFGFLALGSLRAEEPAREAGDELRLRGQGSFRFAGLVPVYSAAYYESALSAKLEVTYHRDFSAEQIVKGGNALLRRNLRDEEWEAVSDSLAALNRAYKDVRAGDTYVLLRQQGKGLGLSLNGEPPIWIACETLSKVYFRIWTGEQPMSERLRDELLGKGRGPGL